ncbi:MAG: glycoside hydrolase family 3 protein [Lachnospiraceae bacterium]|nr:glycoside hydrolase family 3 protein [Lachnospiraceae bacterium]
MKKRQKATKKKMQYLFLGNCAFLLIFLALLSVLLFSENDFFQKQGQDTLSSSAQIEAESSIQTEQKLPQFQEPGQSYSEPEIVESQSDTEISLSKQGNTETLFQQQIQAKIASMTLEEKVAQLFLITPEALTGFSSVTAAGSTTRDAISQYPVGGLIFFEGNLQSRQQVTEMLRKQQEYSQERIGLPLFLSVDEEGGQVTRIASAFGSEVKAFPDIAEIGASGDPDRAFQLGDAIGEYLSDMGFNLDFAPVADVLTNPDNTVVKRRSYGSNPQSVSEMVKRNLEGLQNHQVFGCVKHFPGHGATKGDTHQGYAYTDKSWEELRSSDAVPFQESVDWGVRFVMVGHISLPQVTGDDTPASLSSYVIGHLLREELGYDGIVLTDALNMKAVTDQYTSSQAAVEAILAGNDMILMPEDFHSAYQGVIDAVENGVILQERLEESLRRILELKMQG